MDKQRAEAMRGYFLAVRALDRAAAEVGVVLSEADRRFYERALDEERAATEECLREGVSLVELDALAAIAGSRFAPAWAVRAYGGGL